MCDLKSVDKRTEDKDWQAKGKEGQTLEGDFKVVILSFYLLCNGTVEFLILLFLDAYCLSLAIYVNYHVKSSSMYNW